MSVVIDNQARTFTALIADDHEFVRNWLRDELTRNFPRLGSLTVISTAQEAISQAVALKPDLIFLDIDFENDRTINGIDAAERIWKEHSDAAIIIVSSHKGEVYIKHLYKVTPASGAYGYILKDKVAKHLVEATNAVLSGDCWVDPEIARIGDRLKRSNQSLSDNEYVALVCIALGLSDTTSGRLLCLTEKAIQARLQLLYAKFGIPPKGDPNAGIFNPRCRAVRCGLQRGLINESELQAWATEFSGKAKEIGVEVEL